jgi:L-alanine-DL-glutamate epimerase-like enolase superfamily enzyme
MPRLDRIEAGHYRIPLPEVLTDSTHGAMAAFELVTCRVHDAEGAEGVGYTYTVGRNGGAVHHILAREIAELAAGQEADRIEALWQHIWWGLHYGGRGGPAVLAQSALDIALWDLKAKRAGLALWRLLGGHDPRVPCYAGGIDLDLSAEELIRQTDGNLARGFRAIKMKVGRPRLSEDVAKLAAMRAHLGEGFPLMVDANMRWTADAAIRAARAFAPHDPYWLEEPTPPEDVAGHARVLREGGVPVASGENLRSLWDFQALIAAGGVSYPEPDVTNCGGVTAFMKIAHLAEAFHLPVTSHGAHDVTVQLLAACPNRSYLEAHGFGLDRYIAEPLRIEEGMAVAPDRPGHGIAFDWAGLEKVRA